MDINVVSSNPPNKSNSEDPFQREDLLSNLVKKIIKYTVYAFLVLSIVGIPLVYKLVKAEIEDKERDKKGFRLTLNYDDINNLNKERFSKVQNIKI